MTTVKTAVLLALYYILAAISIAAGLYIAVRLFDVFVAEVNWLLHLLGL